MSCAKDAKIITEQKILLLSMGWLLLPVLRVQVYL